MNPVSPTLFAEHIETSCGALVRDAAPAIDVDIEVLDETGRVVLNARRDPDGIPPKWAFATDISVSGATIGKLRASSASEPTRVLLNTLANDIGSRVSAAVEMDCMIERLAVCYDELELLYRMSSALRPEKRITETCSALLEETSVHISSSRLFFYLSKENYLELDRSGRSEPEPSTDKEPYCRMVAAIEDGARQSDDRHRGTLSVGAKQLHYVGFPVREQSKVVGFVGLQHEDASEPPETGELKILECLALQLTDVVTRSALLDELRDMLFNTVKSLVAAVDAKDAYTRGHSERVYRLSVGIGERLGLAPEVLQNLAWAALLHDIGKIAIPEEILRKAGPLTNDEFRMIQAHPVRGEKMLAPITQLAGILPGIRSHHERIDGRGYPDRIAGEAIPLIARIIAVADTYDALVSTRAYRRARTREFALREIERSAGTQLDPEIVAVFLEIAREHVDEVPGPDELPEAA